MDRGRRKRFSIWYWSLYEYCWILVLLVQTINAAPSQDNRCYLSNGGSSETITVPESTKIGTRLGNLSIIGNPNQDGDIDLYVLPENAPVGVEAFTKTLFLRSPLDKEGENGVQSVQINVVCSQKGPNSLNISIPVRVIVTDVNDNAPIFVGAPYILNISEVTVINTTVMSGIKAIDKDQPGPFNTVEYFVKQNEPYSHLLAFENRLEGNLILTASLDYETLPRFTVTLIAQDQGSNPQSASTILTVNVQDADDLNPKFLQERYVAHLPAVPRPGVRLNITPEAIRAEDTDAGIMAPIVYSFKSEGDEYSYFTLNKQFGYVYLSKPLPDPSILPITLVIRATQVDNADRYALTTLTVASDKPLPNELKFTQTDYVTTALESTPTGHVVLTVQTTKTVDKNTQFQLLDNGEEHFAIRDSGELILTKPLDYETKQVHSFRIMASDGNQSDIARINITVMNTNDHNPTFSKNHYTFTVSDDDLRIGTVVGKVEVTDMDYNDTIELTIKGPFAKVFTVDQTGRIMIKDYEYLNTTVCHMTVYALDSGSPARSGSVTVTVQFPEGVLLGGLFRPKKETGSYILLVVFGVLLGTLLVVILTLAVYILKSKQYRDRLPAVLTSNGRTPNNKVASYSVANGNKPRAKPDSNGDARNGVENPIFNINDDQNPQSNGHAKGAAPKPPLRTSSGTLISAWEPEVGTSPQLTNGNAPRMANGHSKNSAGVDDNIGNGKESKIHNVQWPNGSIPRRVKKLSWEDEKPPNKTELDPDVSVAPLSRISKNQAQPDLTVYF